MGRKKKCFAPGCMSSSDHTGMKFFHFTRNSARAVVLAARVGLSCTTDSARMLYDKVLCSKHFSESDFTTAESIVRCLTRIYIPWWCKRRNRLMTEAARQRATERKKKILSHQ